MPKEVEKSIESILQKKEHKYTFIGSFPIVSVYLT